MNKPEMQCATQDAHDRECSDAERHTQACTKCADPICVLVNAQFKAMLFKDIAIDHFKQFVSLRLIQPYQPPDHHIPRVLPFV